MLTAALRKNYNQTGARPFDPYRDSRQVTELISLAFEGRLGPDGEVALAEMQRMARWGPLLWSLHWPRESGSGIAPGFVWIEQGRIVGNVSLRRALEWGGFFIGNVAVHPDYRGHGIATALMEAAVEAIAARGGRWAGLEVRADNVVARRLYGRLGFREVGRTVHIVRPPGLPGLETTLRHPGLRRGRSHDSVALIDLVWAVVPASQRPLLELRKEDYRPGWGRTLDYWFTGRREVWWVIEEEGIVSGAVRALQERGRRPNRLEVLVAPEQGGHLEALLVQRGVASLGEGRKKMIAVTLPRPTEVSIAVMRAAGFQELRVLVQMRLNMGQRISVRV